MQLTHGVQVSQSTVARREYIKRRQKHLDLANAERKDYDERVWLANEHPDMYLSIAMDFMTKLPLPHRNMNSHNWNSLKFLNILSHAVLDHTGKTVHFTQVPHFMKKSWNLQCSLLLMYFEARLQQCGTLPRVLMIQVDNCGAENKNRVFFAFLGWLVAHGVFDTVVVSYLITGHTHIDVDRNFSFHEVYLRAHNYATLDDLHDMMKFVSSCSILSIFTSFPFSVAALLQFSNNSQLLDNTHLHSSQRLAPVITRMIHQELLQDLPITSLES